MLAAVSGLTLLPLILRPCRIRKLKQMGDDGLGYTGLALLTSSPCRIKTRGGLAHTSLTSPPLILRRLNGKYQG